ncbi:MAG: molybdate ABC transporter substrate-binding protein [Anaerolineae bacterium]
MKRLLWILVVGLVLLVAPAVVPVQAQEELVVFAAASLTDAFEDVAAAFEAENPNINILFNFGSSSALAAQLNQGAPADVFASANNTQMQVAVEGGRIAGTPHPFVKNRLVVITPADNPASITTLADLANAGIQLLVAAPEVPVRTYTDTMLERLAADPAYGEAYRMAVLGNIVSEEPNVRQVAAKIALGEADAGVVYISDVTPDIADQVLMIEVPDTLNTIATYPIAITHDTAHPALAQAFVDFVLSDAGQAILVNWNFVSVHAEAAEDTTPAASALLPRCGYHSSR